MAEKFTELYRSVDPGRGSFEVETSREPIRDENNPQGTRHINKTYEDSLPVAERVRVQRAEARRSQPSDKRSNEDV